MLEVRLLVEDGAGFLLTAPDGGGEPDVDACPDCDVTTQQKVGVDIRGEEHIGDDEEDAPAEDDHQRGGLGESEGEKLVLDMALVGEEGIAVKTHTAEIDPHHIEGGDD